MLISRPIIRSFKIMFFGIASDPLGIAYTVTIVHEDDRYIASVQL